MKKIFTTLCLLMLSLAFSISAQAEDIVYDFSTSIPSAWTSSMTPKGYETSGSARGTQFMENGTLTLKGAKDVTKVVVECSCNIASGSSISLSVGGTTWGTENLVKESGVQKSFTGASASGDVVLSLSRTEKSIWIKTITVTCGEGGQGGEGGEGGEGEGGGTTTELDPNYAYAEPTIITTPGALGSNAPYQFIQNNIEVKCSTGGVYDTDFRVNAGQTITFTATKAIKGISIDGYVKKGFDIDVSAGSVEYYSDDEEDVEANPVVLITDIDAKTVTLNCVKQLRCYNVSFYFVENPDGDIDDGGGDEGDYTYEYEPTEATTLNITFDEMEYADYSEFLGYPYTDLYFISDDYEMELAVFAPAASGTALAPGTYQITSDYAEGTIQASPGGDAEYDYPSCIYAGFEYDEDYDAWYYNAAYYLISGTLTVANDPAGVKMTLKGKSYYGSTVNATFIGKPINANGEEEEGIDAVSTTEVPGVIKQIRNNQIIIRQGKHSYDLQGRKM